MTSGQEMERVNSYNPGARTGQTRHRKTEHNQSGLVKKHKSHSKENYRIRQRIDSSWFSSLLQIQTRNTKTLKSIFSIIWKTESFIISTGCIHTWPCQMKHYQQQYLVSQSTEHSYWDHDRSCHLPYLSTPFTDYTTALCYRRTRSSADADKPVWCI